MLKFLRWRANYYFHLVTLRGWCLLIGHRWTWSHLGDPAVGALHICKGCGKFERAPGTDRTERGR
jgi:hypothetical protein